jgi:superfamily II DNA/RNA helicase
VPDTEAVLAAGRLLRSLQRKEFPFQAELAARCLTAVRTGERLLVTAPTGTGKTLISQLTMALFAALLPDRLPRILLIVPSRGLAEQHFSDAAWLRDHGPLALHKITSDTPLSLVPALLNTYGVTITTPITMSRRLDLFQDVATLHGYDFAVFDEIDTYLTLEELSERRDTFPILQACLEAELPVLGFTGTNLSQRQESAWHGYGFKKVMADVPREWLPFTRVAFVGIEDQHVQEHDDDIRHDLGENFWALAERLRCPPSWRTIKILAADGIFEAVRILRLCAERLELFESFGSSDGKLHAVREYMASCGPSLVLTRFRRSAELIASALSAEGQPTSFAHGGMDRYDIARTLEAFRLQGRSGRQSLVLTRELGGRGLDFPDASGACLFSPRSNYQAVAQELARIRSRAGAPKEARIPYFTKTAEEAKARRLGLALRREKYGGASLFEINSLPGTEYKLSGHEGRWSAYEETLAPPGAAPGDEFLD